MGKTEKGAIYLDPELVSPYEFYQYWVNVPDADVNQFLSLFTFLPLEEIRELAKLKDREINRAKEVLAKELTSIVHGKAAAEEAQQTSRSAFGQVGASDLSAMPTVEIPRNQMVGGLNVIDLFSSSGLCSSKSEARRLVSQGGAYVNSKNIQDPATVIDQEWVRDGIVVLRAGKKRYYKVVVTE
jgi:tyrosyl-tRNA synthetase